MFKFKSKSEFYGAYVGLDNGSFIAVWKARCTNKPKSNLQNIWKILEKRGKKQTKKWNSLPNYSTEYFINITYSSQPYNEIINIFNVIKQVF